MLSPRDSSANKMARLVMRTQAVPACASAKGSTKSATMTSTSPSLADGEPNQRFISGPVRYALAQQA